MEEIWGKDRKREIEKKKEEDAKRVYDPFTWERSSSGELS